MSEHSPGPWSGSTALSSDAYHIRYINDADGNMVAEVRSGFSHLNPDPFGQSTALANANLIKAAPELLDALKLMLEVHPPLHNNAVEDMAKRRAIARAAIAKSRGEK